jgi:hypothetical protein
MKKIFKYFLGIFIFCAIILVSILSYVQLALPNVGVAPDMKVELTPERIARGKYLANNVLVCMDCHSKRDWTKFSGPPMEGTLGMGGEIFDQKFGFPRNLLF